MEQAVIDELLAERAITKVLTRYCRASDRCDAGLMSTIYHEDAYEDHGDSFRGAARDYVSWVVPYVREQFLSTMHTLHNVLIDVDEDFVRAESYCVAHHIRAVGDDLVMDVFGCRYLDRFERRSAIGWRIAHRVVVREWQLRQPMLSERDQAPGYLTGRRDGSDLSYLAELPRRAATLAGQAAGPMRYWTRPALCEFEQTACRQRERSAGHFKEILGVVGDVLPDAVVRDMPTPIVQYR